MSLNLKDLITIHDALERAWCSVKSEVAPGSRSVRRIRIRTTQEKIAAQIKEIIQGARTPLGTKNFSRGEFRCRDGSHVPEEYEDSTQLLMEQLEGLRTALNGASITIISGYRSPEHNARINGARNSKHVLGEAADIKVHGHSPTFVADTIAGLIEEGKMVQGGLGRYNTFTHYDVRGTRARWDKRR